MKKLIAFAALLWVAMAGSTQAAIVTASSSYRVDFASVGLAAATSLPTSSTFLVSATFDDVNLVGNEITIVPSSPTDTFEVFFGTAPGGFTAASDLYGGPLLQVQQSGSALTIAGLWFETLFSIGSGPAAGNYLLSFSGSGFQVTPEGNTTDFVMTGAVSAVPLPGVLPLLLAGLGGLGFVARRKKQ
ncbi:PEP-CTERM sorting domain-containing protein [Piscinibacter sp. HJYY11]|uniref:PEP-CTERM sorting domain-containing protein n=1 Tax=Piscinibacter sp. HJYY11 TaxID=2801333 RepID=UPI0019200D22|nr:PEP-CTERM sorting domain-containing protein [Piscinibacter sp. HJYY11]MBL0726201.1 hypothetical protein [Piscinibacter sp. HJYY11]